MPSSIAVIVPVIHRPESAAPFMTSFRASKANATVYAVAHVDDTETAQAWRDEGVTVLLGTATLMPPKINAGYRQTTEPWILMGADDIRFHPGWDTAALTAAGDRYHVVGTNDLAHPHVLAGLHTTHPMLRRTYVDHPGACWDSPGVIEHEGYNHQYADDEIVMVARQRDVWVMAFDSHVEHLHPSWGKAQSDAVYVAGAQHFDHDRAEFERRVATHA
jgi:hypothetical protein